MRESSTNLLGNVDTQLVLNCLEMMLRERLPYRRVGYPRAGGFDRLILAVASQLDSDVLFRIYVPRWRGVTELSVKVRGELGDLVLETDDAVGVLVYCGARGLDGERKYGTVRNEYFGKVEVAFFLDALHRELCEQGIPNRIQGGIVDPSDVGQLNIPWRSDSVLGLVA